MNTNDMLFIKRFKLTREQAELYKWLKSKNLNTDEATLCYWVKKYPSKRVLDVVNFAVERLDSGQRIQNLGGWINMFLKNGLAVVNNASKSNLMHLNKFIEIHKWRDVKIYEKYIKDLITGDDLSLTLESGEFQRSLETLYTKSQMYR